MTPKITMTDTPEAHIKQSIGSPLSRFNEAQSGRPDDYRRLALLVSDPVTGEIIGGLWGETMYSYLHVELLFVPEALRRIGVGRQLMSQAEREAIRRGCHGVWLYTFSFQARGFYERLGYTVFATIADHPPGHSRFFLKKALNTHSDAAA